MRYSLISAAIAVVALAVSCTVSQPEIVKPSALSEKEITITASLGEPDTRTERAADGSVLWSPGDQISLFYGSGENGGSCFTAQNTEAVKTVNFTGTIGVITGGNNIPVEDTYFWAVYPYNATASCDGNSITTVLPSAQVAAADTFADDLFPSMGRSQGLNISFYNICGGIKFTVSEEGIKSVTLKANSGEQIVGTITAAFDGGVPVVTNIAGGSDTITLSAPEGETFEVGKAYFFVMVPTVFQTGFTMTFSKGYARAERVINSKATIKRSVFGTMNTPDAGLEWEMLYVPIPDENFSAYMIQNFDTNGNGVLDFDEAEVVTNIDVNTDNIASLSGVEYCPNLRFLSCFGSWISAENTYVGSLADLDLSRNTALMALYCSYNQLTSLDVSANTALRSLYCSNNHLTSLDVSANTALTKLYCGSNQLTKLDVSNNPSLNDLRCGDNNLITLDLSTNTALQWLQCGNNQLTSLDLSANTALTNLSCGNNQLTSLDVSLNTALDNLSCAFNSLTSLDVSSNIALTSLYCVSNQLSSLDVSANTELTSLCCSHNQLTNLDVSSNTALTNLSCGNNQLTSLDVSLNTALDDLDCRFNSLTSLDVSSNTALTNLYCDGNQLTSLDVSSNTALTNLSCSSNQLTSLDVSENTALTNLSCIRNWLTSLDVSKNIALTRLNCSQMNDESNHNLLGYLYIAQGQSIPNVTVNRSTEYIPEETIIIVAPEAGGSEGTIEEPLN